MDSSITEILKSARAANLLVSPGARGGRKSSNPWHAREVELTGEFKRVYALPRRHWEERGDWLAAAVTEHLKRPGGEQVLRAIQAMSLYELWALGYSVCIARVGGGKTLVTFLAPYVTQSLRPLLLVPANLVEKTLRDLERYGRHWKIPGFIRVESYEKLGHPDHEDLLIKYKPDLIMFDEASKMKDPKSIRFQRVQYYKDDCLSLTDPKLPTKIQWLLASGTFTDCSIKEYRHLLELVMPSELVPLPGNFSDFMKWSLALDENVSELSRIKPGALFEFCNEQQRKLVKSNPLKAARQGYRDRFIETPGIISTSKSYLGASLRIQSVEVKVPKNVVKAFWMLRRKYQTPDGQELQDANAVAAQAKTIATGMYLVWDPPPPKEWVEARQIWHMKCRRTIRYTRHRIDSEGQLIRAITKHGLYPALIKPLEKWQYWKAKFGEPNVKAVWIDDFAINFAIKWMKKNPGIVWVYHPEFGERLSKLSGVPFYWRKGFDKNGRFIEDHPPKTPMIASIKSNMEGKNLQFGWNANLFMHPPKRGSWWEQILGRTHRDGQREDEVYADMFAVCREHIAAFWSACSQAEYVQDASDPPPKLLSASVTVPTLEEIDDRQGLLWRFEEGILDEAA